MSDSLRKVQGSMSPDLLAFKVSTLWGNVRKQPLPFWFLCGYIVFEYLRPQTMYPMLDILPWAKLSLLLTFGSAALAGMRPRRLHHLDLLLIAFSVTVVISSVFAWDPGLSLDNRGTFLSWLLLYVCIRMILDSPHRMLLFWVFFALINFKMSQHSTRRFVERGFSFAGYGVSGAKPWFHNSGELALEMGVMFALTATLLMAHRQYLSPTRWKILLALFPTTAALTVIASSSRGGQVALLVACAGLLGATRRVGRGLIAVSLMLVVGWAVLPQEQKARFSTMGDDNTSESRLTLWADARVIAGDNLLTGIGYRNWSRYYSTTVHNGEPVEVVHNTVLEAFTELGLPGGLLFLAMVGASLVMNFKTRKRFSGPDGTSQTVRGMLLGLNLSIVTAFVAAQFMSVLYYPMFWIGFALTAAFGSMSPSPSSAKPPDRQGKRGRAQRPTANRRPTRLNV